MGATPEPEDPRPANRFPAGAGELTMAKTKKRKVFELMDDLTVEQAAEGKWAVFYEEEVLALCASEAIATFVQMAILTANLNPVELE